jgi:hypothetical protein
MSGGYQCLGSNEPVFIHPNSGLFDEESQPQYLVYQVGLITHVASVNHYLPLLTKHLCFISLPYLTFKLILPYQNTHSVFLRSLPSLTFPSQDLQRSKSGKLFMHNCTSVESKWLVDLGAHLASFSAPLEQPEPVVVSASALVTFICVFCTLRSQFSRSIMLRTYSMTR